MKSFILISYLLCWPSCSSGGCSLASHCDGPGSFPHQIMLDLAHYPVPYSRLDNTSFTLSALFEEKLAVDRQS
jgi:hypothetical protein